MADVLTLVIAVAVVGGLTVLVRRNDGHTCSRDGRRFTCRVQPLDTGDITVERARAEIRTLRPTSMFAMGGIGAMSGAGPAWRQRGWSEARATISDGGLHLLVRRGIGRRVLGPCRVLGRSTDGRDRAVFVIEGPPTYQLRVPGRSACVPHLSALIEQ